ncbi:hypothetical protein FGB62_132g024 [Gracilaria domingensis]|nr:hypothetical protein FGB62_132g024 [Gracilaria domingensis]
MTRRNDQWSADLRGDVRSANFAQLFDPPKSNCCLPRRIIPRSPSPTVPVLHSEMKPAVGFSGATAVVPSSRSMPGWRPRDVNEFLQSRCSGSSAVWQLEGQLIALNTGRVLARVVGVQETLLDQPFKKVTALAPKSLRLSSKDASKHSHEPLTHSGALVVRDTIFYTDSKGLKMTQFRFRPTSVARRVSPVLGRAGRVTIGRSTDESMVLSRSRDEAQLFTTVTTPPLRMNGLLKTGWSFIGRRVKGMNGVSNPGVVEKFELVAGRGAGSWNWSGVGRCPSWYGRGQCVMFLNAKRVRPRELDNRVRLWMKEVGRRNLRIVDADEAEREAKLEREAEEKKKRRKLFGVF